MAKITVVKSESLSDNYGDRFIVVDGETGEILDDAQGYGYKTIKKAYAAWAWKNRDKSKDSEKAKKRDHIKKWLKEHKGFSKTLETVAFEIAKGSWGPEDKFDANLVKKILKDYELKIDFTASELLKVWKNSH